MKKYISITSIYDNQDKLIYTLQSILEQTILPDKCYIFLSEEPYLKDIGFKNKKITNNNLKKIISNKIFEIKWVKNTGPYRKLLPILQEKWEEDCLIITIDDDVFYHPKLVSNFINDYNKYKCCISYRSWDLGNSLKNINYSSRSKIEKGKLNIYNFGTGKGGILYKPSFFHKTKDLIFREDIYKNICPTTDDVWFYLIRILNNINCYSIQKRACIKDYTNIKTALYNNYNMKKENNIDKNTIYIKNTIKKLEDLKFVFP